MGRMVTLRDDRASWNQNIASVTTYDIPEVQIDTNLCQLIIVRELQPATLLILGT